MRIATWYARSVGATIVNQTRMIHSIGFMFPDQICPMIQKIITMSGQKGCHEEISKRTAWLCAVMVGSLDSAEMAGRGYSDRTRQGAGRILEVNDGEVPERALLVPA